MKKGAGIINGKMPLKQQLYVAGLAVALIVALLYSYAGRLTEFHYMYLLPSPRLGAPAENLTVPMYDVSSRNCTSVSLWVVTTSDTKTPSVAVQVLLNSTNDWCVLVLGERKGLGYDFPWTNDTKHLIYLPFEALPFLPFKTVTLPSLDVRNIGYLYAISYGARVILDLENDNIPIHVSDTFLPLLTDKGVYPCPNLEEKEGRPHISTRK